MTEICTLSAFSLVSFNFYCTLLNLFVILPCVVWYTVKTLHNLRDRQDHILHMSKLYVSTERSVVCCMPSDLCRRLRSCKELNTGEYLTFSMKAGNKCSLLLFDRDEGFAL